MRKTGILGVLLITISLVAGACTPTPAPPEESLTSPKLLSPHNRATDIEISPILLWEPVPEAEGYELKVSRNSDFSDIVIEGLLPATSYELTQYLAPSTQYYWMVGAKMNPENSDASVVYSEVWTFTTAEEEEAVPDLTPVKPPPLPEPPPPSPEPMEISATQLSTEYDRIGLAAETQYKNRQLEVSGTFDHFDLAVGSPFISFDTGPEAWEIRAFLADDQEVSKAETLTKGDEITVSGSCQGSSGWYRIILSGCRIITP